MSVQIIKNSFHLLVDLSTKQQEFLTGGQMNSTGASKIPMIAGMPPGSTLVVPDMILSLPPMTPNMSAGNAPASAPLPSGNTNLSTSQ